MQSTKAPATLRPFIAAAFFGALLAGLLWLRPSLGGVESLVGFLLVLAS